MLHPAVLAGVVVVGLVVVWGGYEVASKIYDDYRERENYQEYIREQRSRYQREKFSDDDDDDEPLINTSRRENSGLRSRRRFSTSSDDNASRQEFELSEMENTILERKRRLQEEQAFLDKQEELIKARRSALFQDLESDVTQAKNLVIQEADPMTFNPFSTDFEEEDTDQITSNFQSSLIIQDNNDNHNASDEIVEAEEDNNISSSTTSSELRFPSIVAAPRSIPSDSEESWDAVTDDWNNTDSEESFADPMSSASEDEFDDRHEFR